MARSILIALLLLPALSSGGDSRLAPGGPETAPPAVACRPIPGLEPLLGPGRVLLLGEIHGTVESPAFTLDAACHAARSGVPVMVGLELLPAEQERVDAFMQSPGSHQDRASLLAGPRWRSEYQDGRNSRAMLDLIDGLRRLRVEGLPVRAVLFDATGTRGGQQRERDMAANLAAAISAAPRSMLIALTGNRHSRLTIGAPRNAAYEPMGHILSQQIAPVKPVSLNAAHGGGQAWICAPECGVQELGGRHGDRAWAIELDAATRPAGHNGWYHVGSISASPPARHEGSAIDAVATRREEPSAATPREASGTSVTEPAPTGKEDGPEPPLSAAEGRLQGAWQAYDYDTRFKTWLIRFEGRSFHAQGGPDDWYRGRISVRPDEEPAEIDFAIEDCLCSYKGMTSPGIYRWDGEMMILSAPQPGGQRPAAFRPSSGQMMRLLRPGP